METTPATDDLIFDVSTADFQQRVLDRSHEVPVLVDFWAPWCGPCRTLGPALEQAVSRLAGKLLLAKVNTDEESELAQRFRIQGIPAVKAFHKGRVVNEFAGARDSKFIAGFLAALVPAPGEQELSDAAKLLFEQNRQPAQAEALLLPLTQGEQAVTGARLARALLLLAESVLAQGPARHAEVPAILDRIDARSAETDRAELLRQVLDFFQAADEDGGAQAAKTRLQQNDRDAAARYILAAEHARTGQLGEALEQLFTLLQRDRKYRDDGARRAVLTLFQYFAQHRGSEEELISDYRRRLQVLL